jgi:hypothetical protein
VAALAATSVVALAGLSGSTQAKSKPPKAQIQLAVTGTVAGGGAFTGTFTLQRFAVSGNTAVAVGFIRGSAVTAAGVPLGAVLRGPVELPVTVSGAGARGAAAGKSIGVHGRAFLVQQTCEVLHLELGAVAFDLLGLQVNTQPIVIDLLASGGGTDVLGSLICTALELVGNVIGLVDILNSILGLLTGLLGGLTGGLGGLAA